MPAKRVAKPAAKTLPRLPRKRVEAGKSKPIARKQVPPVKTKATPPTPSPTKAPVSQSNSSKSDPRRLEHHQGCNCPRCRKEKSGNPVGTSGKGSAPQASTATASVATSEKTASVTATVRPKPKVVSVKATPPSRPAVAEGFVIYDPKHPNVLFDGLVRVYSTCRDCGQSMQVIRADCPVHPCCEPKPTVLESLATGWLSCMAAGDQESADLTEAELERLANEPKDFKAFALEYVSWGWPVFPLRPFGTKCGGEPKCAKLCECPKEPATKHGFKDATIDPERINRWWTRHPNDNIGLATGHEFDVLDIDPRSGGVPSFMELLEAKRIPDTHGIVVSASGGMHFYLKATGKGNRAKFMPGLDYRGIGGYVVAPPSTLGKPNSWTWMTVPSPAIRLGENTKPKLGEK